MKKTSVDELCHNERLEIVKLVTDEKSLRTSNLIKERLDIKEAQRKQNLQERKEYLNSYFEKF